MTSRLKAFHLMHDCLELRSSCFFRVMPLVVHASFLCYIHDFQVNIICGSCLNGQCKGMTINLWDLDWISSTLHNAVTWTPAPLWIAFSFVYRQSGLFRSTVFIGKGMLEFLMIHFLLLILFGIGLLFWFCARGLVNSIPLVDIQRDWHALLHGLSS